MNRHVAGRSGETMCRYSWIRNTTPRAAALPAPPTLVVADIFIGPFPIVRRPGAILFAPAAPTAPTTRYDYPAAPGEPLDRTHEDPRACPGRRGATGARPDGVPRQNRLPSRRSAPPEDRRHRHSQ